VYPGVAGMPMQIRHRGLHGAKMSGHHHLLAYVIGQRAQQRHTLRRGERQIETVHTVLGEHPPAGTRRRAALIQPDPGRLGVDLTTIQRSTAESCCRSDPLGVADHQPGRCAGVTFRVILPQTTIGALPIHRRLLGLVCGVVVVGDAEALESRNRQHRRHLRPRSELRGSLFRERASAPETSIAPLCQCAVQKFGRKLMKVAGGQYV
jgi:hypothetical protein